jgi:hypothetical protein
MARNVRRPDAVTPFLSLSLVVVGLRYEMDSALSDRATCASVHCVAVAGVLSFSSLSELQDYLPKLYAADIVAALDTLAQRMADDDMANRQDHRRYDARR